MESVSNDETTIPNFCPRHAGEVPAVTHPLMNSASLLVDTSQAGWQCSGDKIQQAHDTLTTQATATSPCTDQVAEFSSNFMVATVTPATFPDHELHVAAVDTGMSYFNLDAPG